MDYNKVIQQKNKILCLVLLVSIILRCVVNAAVTGIQSVIGLGVAGITLSAIVIVLCFKIKNGYIMMYGMVAVLSALSIMCMVLFPCTTNFLMFFLAIFMIVIYENFKPILLQCIISMICMIFFYQKYAERLNASWTPDALVMCIVYIVSGMFVFGAMCHLSRKSFEQLGKVNAESIEAKEKAEDLLGQIKTSVNVLDSSSDKIKESIQITDEISGQIAIASEEIATKANEEVEATEQIRLSVTDGVNQIQDVAKASIDMTQVSQATNQTVEDSSKYVETLTNQMSDLEEKMNTISDAMLSLSEENGKIIEILGTLDSITSQTNLLSLNASIEAARAGEHGKGFAVVASEIRNLSEDSRNFTEQIHEILNGINDSTNSVCLEIKNGQESMRDCADVVKQVDVSFKDIHGNTMQVLSRSKGIEERAEKLDRLLETTMSDVNQIGQSVESTSAAMQQISSSIISLHDNIDSVVSGYREINRITKDLMEASRQ